MQLVEELYIRHSLEVSKESIEKLLLILKVNFPNTEIVFSATLKNDAKIIFDSIDELFTYDNFGKYSIVVLSISGKQYDSFCIVFNSSPVDKYHIFTWSANVRYHQSKKTDSTALKANLSEIFQEMKPSFMYNILCIMPMNYIFYIYFTILFIFVAIESKSQMPLVTLVKMYVLILPFLILFVIYQIALLPRLQFALGKEIKRIKSREKLRQNIFWGIICSVIICIVSGLVIHYMTLGFLQN